VPPRERVPSLYTSLPVALSRKIPALSSFRMVYLDDPTDLI
jgi:hypothetical protein